MPMAGALASTIVRRTYRDISVKTLVRTMMSLVEDLTLDNLVTCLKRCCFSRAMSAAGFILLISAAVD